MIDQPSQINHTRSFWHQGMSQWGTVQTMLQTHRNCTAGYGATQDNCGRRAYLLELRRQQGWTFPIPPPDGMLSARQTDELYTITEAVIDVQLPSVILMHEAG